MFGAFFNVKAAALPSVNIRTILTVWVVAEVVALVLVIKLIGFGGAVLLSLLSSVFGIVLLRRVGVEAALRLNRAMTGQGRDGALLDGTLATLGAVLLILPGFVSDAVGLALAAPSIRQVIRSRLGGSPEAAPARPFGRGAQPDVIDLPSTDWRVVEPTRRP